ncbi:universal stress protein [Woeseia oceani]|nr:universal stress protein [Woeseia oceani]
MRFANILLLLDSTNGHMRALDRAAALARNEGAALTVCGVVNSVPTDYIRNMMVVTFRELTDIAVEIERERLKKLVKTLDAKDLSISIKVLVGRPHSVVSRAARLNGHDLIIKSTCGRRTLRSLAAHREDRDLLRFSPCPVWLVSSADGFDQGCILAAIGMPDRGPLLTELDSYILAKAAAIALAEFRELHVVHAWQLSHEGHMRSFGTKAANLEVDRMIAREAALRTNGLRRAIEATTSESARIATDFLAPHLHIIKGHTENVVPELADRLGAGLIVMGTAARTGLSGLWIGNTAEKVLSRSDRSFLIVKAPERAQLPTPKMNEFEKQDSCTYNVS